MKGNLKAYGRYEVDSPDRHTEFHLRRPILFEMAPLVGVDVLPDVPDGCRRHRLERITRPDLAAELDRSRRPQLVVGLPCANR
jgi:hypothetical protein